VPAALVSFRLALLGSLVLVLSACSATEEPVSPSRVPWPDVHFTEVRGYLFNLSDQYEEYRAHQRIIVDGRLDETVIDRDGVVLASARAQQLVGAINPQTEKRFIPFCMIHTRHAFVFYDEQHRPCAWIAICFQCGQSIADPEADIFPDYAALRRICDESGLPVFDDETRYASLRKPEGLALRDP
jgi:hypothetical protein